VRSPLLVLLLGATLVAHAAPEGASAPDGTRAAAGTHLTLRAVAIEPAPDPAARYTLRARLAPVESPGELRESGSFALIGRFAKAGASCDGDRIFSDGFED
jgi:hypothetical protein